MDNATSEQCNFSFNGGNATGTYQFQTGLYGLTDMPTEFQKAIDLTLIKCTNTYAYLDDILILRKESFELHKQKHQAVLTTLDEESLVIKFEWLRYTINSEGMKPLINKQMLLKNFRHQKLSNN